MYNLVRRASRKRRDAPRANIQQGQALSHIPLRRLHGRLAHQGRNLAASPFSGMKDRLGQSFDFQNHRRSTKTFDARELDMGCTYVGICENVSDRAWYGVSV